ncbi:MAG TPA: gamma carbonic anhydrase family protein [Acidobacteriaceae bacterium]|jgi:carbonic anhydrase/acetyltransferase-like protein (isoleucine patch superfamily)|nr:gamma carbonic anhydrase family protein [Acidobacteriaceae bacterium]
MIRTYQGVTPTIPASCYIDLSAQVIGDVVLGEHSSVWMNAVVRGDVNSIRIGAHSNVQDCAVLHGQRYKYPVIVGDWVTIGHNATVHGCVIEDVCLIGIGSTILNNARIGEGSIIAAGAVIPEGMVIPPHSLVAGVPGKVRRDLTSDDHEEILLYARNYLDYVKIYLEETRPSRIGGFIEGMKIAK